MKNRRPRRERKRVVTQLATNKVMNPEVFELRRKVIAIVREARDLFPRGEFPRIEVRITDNPPKRDFLGVGRMNKCMIWIPEMTVKMKPLQLRHVVFHEIGHAAFGANHTKRCKLMHPIIQDTTRAEQDKALLKVAKNKAKREKKVA